MKIAILNISIGRYSIFWEDFYKTCEMNFIPEIEKDYYVFTDCKKMYRENDDRVKIIHQENLGWPFNTMKRFRMFKRVEDKLVDYDYVFFINGNALFKEELSKDFIKKDKSIITIIHPGIFGTPRVKMPFERNPESNAYIGFGEGKYYVQGAFIGGTGKAFVEMIDKLDILTEDDLKKDIIAVWHDESFLNKYILNRNDVQIMGRQYLYYEEYVFPWNPIILLRNKRAYGDLKGFRGLGKEKSLDDIKNKVLLNIRNVIYKLGIIFKMIKFIQYKDDHGYVDIDLNTES